MGYQRASSPRGSGRGYGTQRHDKSKAKRRKHRSIDRSIIEKNSVPTEEQVVDRTLKWLSNLGSQKFASYPYSEHFSRWLMNVKNVVSEFESSPNINPDDQFMDERSQILTNVELKLKDRHQKEISVEEAIKNLSDDKILLEKIKMEFVTMEREIERRKNDERKRLENDIDSLRSELDSIARIKTGLFRGISEKEKRQKEAETTRRIDTAERELELMMLNFATEQGRLRNEFESKQQPIINQIRDYQKHIETQEIDGSQDDRQVACEALINSVNALFQRKMSQSH